MTVQQDFVSRIQGAISSIAATSEGTDTIVAVAMARGYDQWTDEDLAHVLINGLPLTRVQLLEMVGLLQAVKLMMDNVAVPAANRRVLYNRYRGDI